MRAGLAKTLEGVTTVAAFAVLPACLWAIFALGLGEALAVFFVGYMLVVPALALLTGLVAVGSVPDYWTDESDESTPRSDSGSADAEADPLDRLRERYARGEIGDAEFERRVEELVHSDGEDRTERVRDREPVPERE